MSTHAAVLPETMSDPRVPAALDLERDVAFEAIRAQLFAHPRQPVSIGRFEILERIGNGGMGVVYAAADPQLGRKVAIKVVRDLGGDEEEIERARRSLEREARAAAGLSHPNVVTVYDSGRFGDGFYVAMELVDGRTLRQWLKQAPRRWTEIVTMFIGAGRGLQAAHAAGLAHCDFKPDNVLVGPDDRPQVSDFGLVRWIESRTDSELEHWPTQTMGESPGTLQSVIAGTPRYMAPEQRLGLPIGPRSDQFSFCVALYESLFGALPYVRGEDLPFEEPGVLGRAHARSDVPRAIVRAILVGLSLAPEQRHDSMAVLVERLEQAMARRRRRKWWATGVLLAATTGAAGYAMAGNPVDPCEGAAAAIDEVWSDEARSAVQERLRATGSDARATRVAGLLDAYADDWGAMRRASCEATHHRGGQSPELFELRTACLERRRNALEGLVSRLQAGDEAISSQVVSYAETLPPVAECEAEHIRTHALVDAGATHNERTRSLESQLAATRVHQRIDEAELLAAQGKLPAAIELLRDIEAEAREAGLLYVEASAINFRVSHELAVGSGEGAIAELRRALALALESRDFTSAALSVSLVFYARRLGAPDPIDTELLLELGRACARNSVEPAVRGALLDVAESELLAAEARYDDALKVLDASLERLRAADQADHGTAFRVRAQRGRILLEAARPKDALEGLTEVLARQRELLGPGDLMVGDTAMLLGEAHRMAGNLEPARSAYQEALRIFTASLGPKSMRAAQVMSGLAAIHHEQGELAAARETFEAGIAVYEALLGREHLLLASPLNYLAEVELELKEYDAGLSHAKEARGIIDAVYGSDHPYSAAFGTVVGKLELGLGDAEAAVATLTPAHRTLFAHEELNPVWRGEVAFYLGRALLQHDPARRSEADALSRQAIAEYAKAQSGAVDAEIDEIAAWRAAQGFARVEARKGG